MLVQNGDTGPKRLHVTNIPFRFRDHDLVQMFGVSFDDDDNDDDYDNYYDNNNRFIYLRFQAVTYPVQTFLCYFAKSL